MEKVVLAALWCAGQHKVVVFVRLSLNRQMGPSCDGTFVAPKQQAEVAKAVRLFDALALVRR
jgi:hypothetical protein